MTKNMYTVAGDGPCNEELALRIQAGDKNAAERLISQNEGYLTELARAYIPWCELEDLKQEAALSDYAARHAFPLSDPASRGSQLRTVAHLRAEVQNTSEAELTKAVCKKLKVSSKAATALLKEYQTLLMQRMEEVLTPRELSLVRSYLGIGQPDEVDMTFQELAIRLRSGSTTTAPAERRRRTRPRCGN